MLFAGGFLLSSKPKGTTTSLPPADNIEDEEWDDDDMVLEGELAGYTYHARSVNGAEAGDASPVVVLFHGKGGDPYFLDELVTDYIEGPAHLFYPHGPEEVAEGRYQWWSERAKGDQTKLANQMSDEGEDLYSFLMALSESFGRPPIVAGHSQGGMVAALMGAQYPGVVDTSVAASAWLPEGLSSDDAFGFFIHGDQDTVVPFERTANWLDDMIDQGAPVTFIEVEGAGHSFSDVKPQFLHALNQAIAAG